MMETPDLEGTLVPREAGSDGHNVETPAHITEAGSGPASRAPVLSEMPDEYIASLDYHLAQILFCIKKFPSDHECYNDLLRDRLGQSAVMALDKMQQHNVDDAESILIRWVKLAIELVHDSDQGEPIHIAVFMIIYGTKYLGRNRARISDTGMHTISDTILQFRHICHISPFLPILSNLMSEKSISMRNSQNETLLMVACVRCPLDDRTVPFFQSLISKSTVQDLLDAMPVVLAHPYSVRFIRLFESFLVDRMRSHDFDLGAVLDQFRFRDHPQRQQVETTIRIQIVLSLGWFLYVYHRAQLFWSDSDSEIQYQIADALSQLVRKPDTRTENELAFLEDTIRWAKSGDVSAADFVRERQCPEEFPDVHPILGPYLRSKTGCTNHACALDWSASPSCCGFCAAALTLLRLMLTYSNMANMELLITNETAVEGLLRLLQSVIPDLQPNTPDPYKTIVDAAIQYGPGMLKTNILHATMTLGCSQFRDPNHVEQWAAAFCRPEVLEVRDLWPPLFRMGGVSNHYVDPGVLLLEEFAVRTLSALLQHPDMVSELDSFTEVPVTSTHLLIKQCLKQLPAEFFAEMFMAIDNERIRARLLRTDIWNHAERCEALLDYLGPYLADWIFSSPVAPLSKEEAAMLNDDCSICLNSLNSGDQAHRTQCGHFFHEKCLRAWLEPSYHCPLCRTDLVFFAPGNCDKDLQSIALRIVAYVRDIEKED